MNNSVIFFAKVRETAKIPSKIIEDGAYDIYADFEEEEMVLNPGEMKMIPSGIASAFTSDYRFILHERGSTGTIGLALRSGEIDSGYRGEWFVCLNNTSNKCVTISKKYDKKCEIDDVIYYPYDKAICQANLQIVPKVNVNEMDYSDLLKLKSIRMDGNLGSSGK